MMAQTAPEYRGPDPASPRDRVHDADAPAVKSAKEARQGVTGHGVRYVLMFGLGGVVLAFILIYMFWR